MNGFKVIVKTSERSLGHPVYTRKELKVCIAPLRDISDIQNLIMVVVPIPHMEDMISHC